MKMAAPKRKRGHKQSQFSALVWMCGNIHETINSSYWCMFTDATHAHHVCVCVLHMQWACSGITIHSFIFVGAPQKRNQAFVCLPALEPWTLLWSRANQSDLKGLLLRGERRKCSSFCCSGKDNWKNWEKDEFKLYRFFNKFMLQRHILCQSFRMRSKFGKWPHAQLHAIRCARSMCCEWL